jgi:hypothetical protein
MKAMRNDLIMGNSVFLRIAVAVGILLLVPLIAMQFTAEVNWNALDFAAMGLLLYGAASLFVWLARKVCRRHRILVGIGVAILFMYVWAELAVGVFLSLGS